MNASRHSPATRRAEESDANHRKADTEVDDHVEARQHFGVPVGGSGVIYRGDTGEEGQSMADACSDGRDEQQE